MPLSDGGEAMMLQVMQPRIVSQRDIQDCAVLTS